MRAFELISVNLMVWNKVTLVIFRIFVPYLKWRESDESDKFRMRI